MGKVNDVCKTTVLRNIMTTFSPCIPFTAILMSLPVMYCAHVFKDMVSDYLSMFNFLRYSSAICRVENLLAGFGGVTILKSGADCRHTTVHRIWAL